MGSAAQAPSRPIPELNLIASLTPSSTSRAWQTAVHPRLPLLATCNSEKTVNIYSLTSFTLLSTISGGHKRSIRTVAWKPGHTTDSILATGSFDASVGIWRQDDDAAAGSSRPTDFTSGLSGQGNGDETEEDEEWKFALVLDGHDSEVKGVAWSAGGNLLATCSRDKSVWIWEEVGEDDFETIAVLQEHSADVKCVAWHPEEELLASGSYDDDVRLWREDVDDWDCVAVLRGHESTVWALEFEGLRPVVEFRGQGVAQGVQAEWVERRETSGPRLLSASDDRTIRVWRRIPRERREQNSMSIIRSGSIEETWVEEARLPGTHHSPIYSVAWSRKTGRVVSAGGDGKLVVYEERWVAAEAAQQPTDEADVDVDMTAQADQLDGSGLNDDQKQQQQQKKQNAKLDKTTTWHIVAEFESAHAVYEINHVAWAPRADKGRSFDDEEVIVSTGDDGAVRVWSLNG